MPLFKPNLDCTISKPSGKNLYGEEVLSAPVNSRCAIIKLEITIEHSSVRADSSASRGAAREFQGSATLLFPASVSVQHDDLVEVAGHKLRVLGTFPRHNLQGVLDHYEVTCGIWGKT